MPTSFHNASAGSETNVLQDLVSLLGSSLPMYIADAGIWSYPGDEEIKLALADLVEDQKSIHDRAAALLETRNLPVPGHEYPIQFSGTHDVDIGSLVPRILDGLRRQVSAIDSLVAAAGVDGETAELASEARGTTLGHIDVLAQIAGRARGS